MERLEIVAHVPVTVADLTKGVVKGKKGTGDLRGEEVGGNK